MGSVGKWKQRLGILDEAYSAAVDRIVEHIDGLSDEELEQFRDDLKRPTNTNCAWTLYAGREIALMFVDGVDERRRIREREARAGLRA